MWCLTAIYYFGILKIMAASTTPMSLKIGQDLRARLANLAEIRKRTAHAIACEAVEAYVAREEARERFAKAADEAWQDYQETGLHVTGEEMAAWIESWGTPNELLPPECHV